MDIFNRNGVVVRGVIYDPHMCEYEEAQTEDDVQYYGLYVENDEGLRMHVIDFTKEERNEALKHAKTMAETRATMHHDPETPGDKDGPSPVSKAVGDVFRKLRDGIKTANEIRQEVGVNPVRDKIDIFQDYGGDWRWRRVSAWSNRIIAVSGEVYSDKHHAIEMAARVNRSPYKLEIEE